jgi:hypothetical protein
VTHLLRDGLDGKRSVLMLSNARYRHFTPLLAITAAAVVGCATTASGPDKTQRATATQPAAERPETPYVPTEAELERALLLAKVNSGAPVGTPELILELRGGPHARQKDGETTLHWAARQRPEWVGRLLDLGCELDARDALGWTPLHEALVDGNDDAARVLIKRGADVRAVDALGATTVIWAAGAC